ncbi:PEGA domain-containing protein, partial [candidate division WWE3 bacterium]|nr:PEGA domain-containing protein [candidate division WWE3 bacterium]
SSVNIKSEPSKAIVIVDGNEVGNTPVNVGDLKPGKHLVEVKMEDYETWSNKVNVEIGKDVDLTAMLQLKAGSFTMISEPSDATVYIDDQKISTTPLTIDAPSPGKHLIETRMDGYEKWSRSIDFVHGKSITLTATLQINPGTVSITSEPSNAITLIDSKEVGKTPFAITDHAPGTYTVELRMDGYETWSKSVDFEQGKKIAIAAELKMKAGSISISSNPSEAFINIDGKKSGKTPVKITDLSPGTHLVEVRMDGYEDWSESVDIIGDKENTLTVELLAITASININSNPPEAAIYLDGEKIGTTPNILKSIAIGTHEVEVKLEGFAEWKKTLNVKNGKEFTLNAALQLNTGSANIESDPAEAIVLLDGNDFGKTPVSLTGIKIGIYDVELQKEGYVSCKKTIKIKAGRVNSLTAKLIEMTGSVNVDSKPSNAIVCVNGKEIGNTPANITDLAAGKYELEVMMDCYETWSDSVNIDPGKESIVTAELQIKAGSISTNSEPSNAIILIDNKKVGTTPKILTDLSYEEHLLEIRMDGYEAWSESFNMEPGIELSVVAELQMIAGSVSITSEPTNAMILIDNKKSGDTPTTLTGILPGEHNVEIMIEGYETWSESVEIKSDKENSIAAVLHAITGSINIESNPSEATIFLDGKEVSTTPDTITHAAIGIHEIEVKKEGYAEWKKKLNVKKEKEIALNALLQPVTGSASLESEPSGAVIVIDGEDVGKTPEVITGISPGKHEVEISLEGYDSYLQMVKIKNGKESLVSTTLQRKKGSLILISNPSNAVIYIQGRKSGKTPSTITDLTPGNYTIELSLDDYQAWSENTDIVSGEEVTINAELQVKPGSISVKSKPSDAKIFIDGREAGTTPETIKDIDCGAHTVKLMMEGYCEWSENVEIKPNKESGLTAVLQEMAGSVSIMSKPSNAMILIDGNEIGTTPAIVGDLSPGTHMVNISMDGYDAWSQSVEIDSKQQKELTAILEEATGSVSIKSIPTDALILIDGKKVGTTP